MESIRPSLYSSNIISHFLNLILSYNLSRSLLLCPIFSQHGQSITMCISSNIFNDIPISCFCVLLSCNFSICFFSLSVGQPCCMIGLETLGVPFIIFSKDLKHSSLLLNRLQNWNSFYSHY